MFGGGVTSGTFVPLDIKDDQDPRAGGPGVVGGNRELHRSNYERGMLDLRLQLIKMRSDYLNQINTQSTLLAGCALGMLASGELINMDDGDEGACPGCILGVENPIAWWWKRLCNWSYTLNSVVCLATSLWVLYTATNLINLFIHSTLYGDSIGALVEADNLIESRMGEVRLVFVLSLMSLTLAGLSILMALSDTLIWIASVSIMVGVGWHATRSDGGTVRLYEKYTGLQVNDRWKDSNFVEKLVNLARPFGYEEGAELVERRHETLDPALLAFSKEAEKARRQRAEETSGEGVIAPTWKIAAEKMFVLPKYKLKEHSRLTRLPGPAAPPDSDGSSKTHKARNIRDPTKYGGAMMVQKFWRDKRASREKTFKGYLAKTSSDEGPLDKVRQLAASGTWDHAGAPTTPEIVAKMFIEPPRFSRWFVLDTDASTLSIYTTSVDYEAQKTPKGFVESLGSYAALKLIDSHARIVIALLPRSDTEHARSTNPLATPSRAVSEAKSWYLQAASDKETMEWLQRLRAAGAAPSIKLGAYAPMVPNSGLPPPRHLPPSPSSGGGLMA
jgi:hypothetical protein